jgi:hypothetical protein
MSGEVKYLSDDDEVISWELVENEEWDLKIKADLVSSPLL